MNERIIYPNPDGGVSVIIPAQSVELALKDVPAGIEYEIVTTDAIPSNRTFRGAWIKGNCCVEHDLDKCKEIGHDMRRAARSEEFAPLDKAISLQLPGTDMVAAEAGRQLIRDKYAVMQNNIDAAATPEEIKAILSGQSV